MEGGSNFASALLAGATPDTFDAQPLAPWLRGVVSGEEKPLLQGDDAANAAGLKAMSLGFGGPSEIDMGGGGSSAGGKRKKKKKGKKGKKGKKDEL